VLEGSLLFGLVGIVQSAGCTSSSLPLSPLSRMGWWNAKTKPLVPWRTACSKPRTC
jgi:hypothetical protein